MKLNNRGMTLVEMVVAFAILGIVSTSIFSMLLTGTKTYTKLTTTVKLQQQAQVATSNIERRILNCNGGLSYTSNEEQDVLFLINEKTLADNTVQKELQVVYLKKATNELYLSSPAVISGENISLTFHLLADDVEKMPVTLYRNGAATEVDRVSLSLELIKNDINGNAIKQTLEKTIALRNHPSAQYTCNLSATGAEIILSNP